MSENLTVSDLVSLAYIVQAPQQNAKVKFINENNNIVVGTARNLCKANGAMLLGDDVRDAYLHVTAGVCEHYVSVRHLMQMYREGGFII